MIRSDRALGRLISALEEGAQSASESLERAWTGSTRAQVIGVSGPPGVGKSVLVGRLVQAYGRTGRAVGVLAVDPSSPFSGGAILADRLRMALPHDTGRVFLRSLASRGVLGGLARVVPLAVKALEAAGYDLVFIETVGVGQNEVKIVTIADTVVVVQSPGGGDEVQGLKGGLFEVGDVLVLNKCDLEGVDQAARVLEEVARARGHDRWLPPVVRVRAIDGGGIDELRQAIDRHHEWLRFQGRLAGHRQSHVEAQILSLAQEWLSAALSASDLAARVARGEVGTREAVVRLLQQAGIGQSGSERGKIAPT